MTKQTEQTSKGMHALEDTARADSLEVLEAAQSFILDDSRSPRRRAAMLLALEAEIARLTRGA